MSLSNAEETNKEALPQADEEMAFEGPPRWLKRLVVGMGVVLVVGIFGLFGLVIMKATSNDSKGMRGGCEPFTIALKGRGTLLKIEEDERAVKVWLQQGNSINVRHYQACSGKILRDVTIEADPAPQPQQGAQQQTPNAR